jgi:hypothetical protein
VIWPDYKGCEHSSVGGITRLACPTLQTDK